MKIIVLYMAMIFCIPLFANEDANQLTECLNEAELDMIHLQAQKLNSECPGCIKLEATNRDIKKDNRKKPLATYPCISRNS